MKKRMGILFGLMLVLALSACNSSSSGSRSVEELPSNIGPAPLYLHYTLPDQYNYLADNPGKTVADEPEDLFSDYTLTPDIDYGGGDTVDGYALDQFIDKDEVNAETPDPDGMLGENDARELYAYVIRSGQDGFTNRTKFYDNGAGTEFYNPDLRWDQLEKGYLLDLNYTGKVFFPQTLLDPADGGFMKMFNVKYAYDVYMFRRIDVKRPDAAGSIATFEVAATTESYVDDTNYEDSTGLSTTKFTIGTMDIEGTDDFETATDVKAIPLAQFLTDYVTDAPEEYTYKIVGLGGASKEGWTYADMEQAFYLPDYDVIVRVDGTDSVLSGTKVYFPVRIELISAVPVEYDFSAKNPPAYAKAYDE